MKTDFLIRCYSVYELVGVIENVTSPVKEPERD